MKPGRIQLAIVVALLGVWVGVHARAAAQGEAAPTLSVRPADTPLVVRGLLDGDTTSFSGSVRLTAGGGDVDELLLLASELQHDDYPEVQIARSDVSIAAGTSLKAGTPRDVVVTVDNVKRPGRYTGDLVFLLPGQAESAGLRVPLELIVRARPEVAATPATFTVKLVRCGNGFTCWWADRFLPASMQRDAWQLWLDNQTLTEVTVVSAAGVLRGTISGNPAPATAVEVTLPQTLGAQQVAPLSVQIARSALPPDRYEGLLRLGLRNSVETVTVPANVAVRNGPLGALAVLLLGIFLGRLARSMETAVVKTQMALLPRYYQLLAKVDALSDAAAKAELERALEAFFQTLDAGDTKEETLAEQLSALEAQVTFLADLEALAAALPDGLRDRTRPRFERVRDKALAGDLAQAERERSNLERFIERQLAEEGMMGVREVMAPIQAALAQLAASSQQAWQRSRKATASRVVRGLAFFSGIRLGAATRYWVIRPLLWLALLIVLTLFGMQALYINGGDSFGANGVFDYLALLVWGLTADVTSSALSKLRQGEA